MSDQSKKGVGNSAAIIVAAIVISASVIFATFSGLGATKTVTLTETSTATAASSSVTLHEVTFNETGVNCGYTGQPSYISRWYVTLGGVTIIQPSNATLPFPDPGLTIYGNYGMISKIVFTVPDGSYSYSGSFGLNGTANVSGADVVIRVNSYPPC
jgi:hypothetical protein